MTETSRSGTDSAAMTRHTMPAVDGPPIHRRSLGLEPPPCSCGIAAVLLGNQHDEGPRFLCAGGAACQVGAHRRQVVIGVGQQSFDVAVDLVEAVVAGQVRLRVKGQASRGLRAE